MLYGEVVMVGQMVKMLRKKSGMTQADLAEKVGVSRPTITKWESGDRKISEDCVTPLAEALGVTEKDLREARDSETEVPRDGRVESTLDVYKWRNMIARSGLSVEARAVLHALPIFVRGGGWFVSFTAKQFDEQTSMNGGLLEEVWPELKKSGFVRDENPEMPYTLSMVFPYSE